MIHISKLSWFLPN